MSIEQGAAGDGTLQVMNRPHKDMTWTQLGVSGLYNEKRSKLI